MKTIQKKRKNRFFTGFFWTKKCQKTEISGFFGDFWFFGFLASLNRDHFFGVFGVLTKTGQISTPIFRFLDTLLLFACLNGSKKRVQNTYQVLAQKRGRFLTPFFGTQKPSFLQVFCKMTGFHHLKYLNYDPNNGEKGSFYPFFTHFWHPFFDPFLTHLFMYYPFY